MLPRAGILLPCLKSRRKGVMVGLLQGRDCAHTHCLPAGGLLLWAELSPLPAPCSFCWDSATMGNVLRALTEMATDPPLEDAGH